MASDDQKVSFKYVFIPADPGEDIEERTFETTKKDECMGFITALQQHFKRAGGSRSAAVRAAQEKAFKQHMRDAAAANVSDEVLNVAAHTQMVEPIALVSQAPATGFVGVYLYCDDSASFKQLPVNDRATSIANAAGLHTQVLGDAFVGRYRENDANDVFERLDFTQNELSSSAAWVAEAKAQAARRSQRSGESKALLGRLKQTPQLAAAAASRSSAAASPADVEKDKGNAAYAKGDFQLALEHYTAALSLDPSNTAALNNRAMAYLKISKFEEAAADCSAVLQAHAHNVKALLRRAFALQELGRLEEALVDLKLVLQLEPKNADAANKAAAIEKVLLQRQQEQQEQQEQQQEQQQE